MNTAARHGTPKAMRVPVTTITVRATCRVPPTRIKVFSRASRSRENSMPMVNSSSITPISAAASTTSRALIRPRALGPISPPASRNPTIGTTRTRAEK